MFVKFIVDEKNVDTIQGCIPKVSRIKYEPRSILGNSLIISLLIIILFL